MAVFHTNDLILNGTYRIEKQIGQGAFGDVYLATYLPLGVFRAIKVVRKGDGLGSTEFEQYRDRFRQEAKLGATFSNANIIHVDQFEEGDGELFLIMDYAPGGSLADQIDQYREKKIAIPVERAVQWVSEAADGLARLHENDMVHRDAKPSNILLDANGHAYIADLGLVQLSTSRSMGSSFGRNHPGTPEYMPPEQRPGNYMPLLASADVYSLGCVLFELLTGRQYYHQLEGTSARSLREDTPIWVDKIVTKALQPEAQKRFHNATEMLNALKPGNSRSQKGFKKSRRKLIFAGVATAALVMIALTVFISKPNRPLVAKSTVTLPTSSLQPTNLYSTKATSFTAATKTQNSVEVQPSPTVTVGDSGSSRISPIDGMKMMYVPAGDFLMGSTNGVGDADEYPQHKVYLDAFWIDQTEVTNAMFSEFVKDTGYKTQAENVGYSYYYQGDTGEKIAGANWAHPLGPLTSITFLEDHPVVDVSWADAAAYCTWAHKRLPTEAEWEKAARGPNGNIYPWGNQFSCSKGNFDDETVIDSVTVPGGPNCDGFDRTSPVGSFPGGQSPYHVMDMSGNVWEWVNDWYSKSYYSEDHSNNPQGPSASVKGKVLRGGSWYSDVDFLRSAFRDAEDPTFTNDSTGFRCSISATP